MCGHIFFIIEDYFELCTCDVIDDIIGCSHDVTSPSKQMYMHDNIYTQ